MGKDHSDQSATGDSARLRRPPVPYGQACAGCSKAKCKCVRDLEASGASCQRCRRLGRACHTSRTTRKRGGGRPPNRTAQIEEKLESLVTLLRSQGETAPLPTPSTNQPSTNVSCLCSGNAPNPATGTSISAGIIYNHNTSSYSTLTNVDQLQAEESLLLFRTTYLAAFPLMHIPPTTTAAQLRVQKPHLWLAILSICCKPFSARAPLQERLRRIIAERVVVNFECDMDLLLGQIVFATWGNTTNGSKHAFHMSAVMAATLAQDLKLDRAHGPELSGFGAFVYGLNPTLGLAEASSGPTLGQKERNNEERRAVLACFCLSSSTFHKLGTPPMRWTPHMDDCMRQLASQPECEDDEVLVVMVKCLSILQDIFSSSTWGFGGRQPYAQRHERLSSTLLIKALRGSLDEVRGNTRPPLLERSVVNFWLSITEVMIFDLALQNPVPLQCTNLNLARAEQLQYCLAAINNFLESFVAFKPQEYIGLHIHYWLHFMRCTRIVYRLLIIEDPAWDSKTVQESVDLMRWLERGAEICREIPTSAGLVTDGNDGHSALATNLLRAKSIWARALENAGVRPVVTDGAGGASTGTGTGTPSDMVMPLFPDDFTSFDIYDDAWMSNVLFWL